MSIEPTKNIEESTKPGRGGFIGNGGNKEADGCKGRGSHTFTEKMMKENTPEWWAQMKKLMKAKDFARRKFALAEINKLQIKRIPTSLGAEDNSDISIKITNYGDRGDKKK